MTVLTDTAGAQLRTERPTLLARQPALVAFGLLLLALTAAGFALQSLDPRLLGEVNVWVKPTKFAFSIGVFALTSAWFFGYVRPERRQAWPLRYVVWTTILSGGFELAYIALQAARGEASHFNFSTPLTIAMYALMGVGAVLLITTMLPLAWEIARRPAPGLRPDYRAAVVLGLVLSVALGGVTAGYMSATFSHAVGPEGGHFPLFGWNRLGGDMRVAHFLGLHLEQALPILAGLVAGLPAGLRWLALLAGAAAGTAATLAVFLQALAGQPFLPGM